MKPGDKVKVYQKPYTFKEFEGMATLVSRSNEYTNIEHGFERWNVKFDDDAYMVTRIVAVTA